MNEYDVSVIIPVYNCEKYVKSCVRSILNQDYEDLSKIQIILVDDGSTDKSLKKCYQVQEEFSNLHIEIITGENEGVSSARNKGIKASKGKYIMFLDADDFISKNAIRKLVKFFDEHYDEIDMVTYPMYYYMEETKKKIKIQKYNEFLRGTEIYDLDGYDYELIQTNMNIITKNYFKDNILFDTNMKVHEDTKYDTEILMKKKKLGYVKEVKYLYRKYQEQTTEISNNPYFCFNDFMNLFDFCIKNYMKDDGHLYKYAQAIIINIFRWRLVQDKLFPYFYEKEIFDESINKLKEILKKIDNDIIINDKLMDRYHKIFLLKLKGINFYINTNHLNKFTINSDNDLIDIVTNIEIIVNRFKVKNNKIHILAYLKSPLLYFKKPKLYIQYLHKDENITNEEIELKRTNADLYKSQIKVAKFYMFEYEIDMENVKKFNFKIVIDDAIPIIKFYFNRWTPFNSKVNSFKTYSGKYRVQYKNGEFYISIPKKKTRNKDFIRSIKRYLKINNKINIYRFLAKMTEKKYSKIWIYTDRKNIFDNGYLQFKHDIKIKDNVEKYYILDGNIKNVKEKFSKEELKNVVKFGSLKHKLLYLNSDKILTSFSSLAEYSPFAKNYQYYKDILKYDLIYLQHGILHAKLLKMYSKIFTPIDKFVISSQFEKNNLINNYEYDEKDLICCGMPRLEDNKEENTEPENKIIFAPSWREYLIGKPINRKRKINKNKFKNSKYYKETIDFLTNEKLLKVLKEKGIVIDYKLHPIFEKYKGCFNEVINDNISVSIGNTDLSKCKAFITDFSSFQFDFVKLIRPIVYFVPDMDEFKAGLHTYRELDLKYEDAFGKLCKSGEELVEEMIKLIENNFEMDSLYKERMENFFFKVDNRKDKLYEALKND